MKENQKSEELILQNKIKSRSVITDDINSNQIEVIAVNEDGKVNELSLDYNEYRNNLDMLYKTSTLENSIISTYSIIENICKHTITINESSSKQENQEVKTFEYNSNFINNFLIPMVQDYNRLNEIFTSNIEILDEHKANFIARTKKNDSLIIIGISIELANMFKDIVTKKDFLQSNKPMKKINNKGISNTLVIFLTVLAIGMLLIGIVLFLRMTNK